jgi:hypothetical protein
MDLKRIARHLFSLPRALPASALASIEQAIAKSETTHRGEIRFAAEGALDSPTLFVGRSARAPSRCSRNYAYGTPRKTTAC